MDREAWQATVHAVARVRHNLVTKPPSRKGMEISEGSQVGSGGGCGAARACTQHELCLAEYKSPPLSVNGDLNMVMK